MTVYIVTDSELGWDCVVAVYSNAIAAQEHADDRNGGPHGTSNVSDMCVYDEADID